MKWLVAALVAYWMSGFVKRTIERGKARSLEAARRRAPRVEPREARRPKSPSEVLGVSPHASSDEISRAYKTLAAQYHPDKLTKSAPEIQELAAHRLREINAAYAELTRKTA